VTSTAFDATFMFSFEVESETGTGTLNDQNTHAHV